MELTQHPTQRLQGAIALGARRIESDTDHSLPSSAEGLMPNVIVFVCIHGASKSKLILGIE
jgi:hypothetical protein